MAKSLASIKPFNMQSLTVQAKFGMALKVGKPLILIAIVIVAFIYRFMLVTLNVFPPGADIGLHESVIKSITTQPTDFFWNNYHMGGGLSLTNPGFHIFTAFLIALTGMQDYLAQALVATLFSTLIVAAAFLVTRRVWGETAAFVVAVLAAFSASDIVMLSWAGYPNIVTLALIPGIFYLLLKTEKTSWKSMLAATSILVGALFLTHVFSALVFLAVTGLTLFVCAVFRKKTGLSTRQAVLWLLPIGLGVLLVSPYLIRAVPTYFGAEGNITGAVASTVQAVLETRLIPLEIMAMSLVSVCLFFVLSKAAKGRWLTTPTMLFACWTLVPILATQSFRFGVYLDYERFLYFLALPVIVCVGLLIASIPNAVSRVMEALRCSGRFRLGQGWRVSKRAGSAVLLAVLVVGVLFTPLFALPNAGVAQADFFQVIDTSEYQAIEWIKDNTPQGSVCVADANFGWWLSGFAQRPTLSAVDPQYLILKHEIAPAVVARDFLAADYLVDNGLMQVKQWGAYANASTHEIYAVLSSSYIPSLAFALNDSQIGLVYRENGVPQQINLSEFAQAKTTVQSNKDNASFVITRENGKIRLIEEITIFRGVNFAKVTFSAQSVGGEVFDWLHMPFLSRGAPLQVANSIVILDNEYRLINQIVFPDNTLGDTVMMQENRDFYELIYNLQGNQTASASFFVGLCQFNPDLELTQLNYLNSLIVNNTQNYMQKTADLPLNCFDYQAAIKQWNISYVAIRDLSQMPRFSGDPTFMLVYKNDKVAIYKTVQS